MSSSISTSLVTCVELGLFRIVKGSFSVGRADDTAVDVTTASRDLIAWKVLANGTIIADE